MELTRKQRREQFMSRMAEPETFEQICDDVADGKTMIDVAVELNANFRWLYSWVNDEFFPERKQAWDSAETARDIFQKESIVGQLHRLGNMDIREAFDGNGNLLPIHQIPEHIAKGIASIDVSTSEDGETTKKLRFTDRGQMLALGGRRHRMFVDKVEVSGQMSLEQAVMESVKPRE